MERSSKKALQSSARVVGMAIQGKTQLTKRSRVLSSPQEMETSTGQKDYNKRTDSDQDNDGNNTDH